MSRTPQSSLLHQLRHVVAPKIARSHLRLVASGLLLLLPSLTNAVLLSNPAVALPETPPAEAPRRGPAAQSRTDRHGDPLPDGAIARLGTVRWRHGYFISSLAYSPDGKKIAAVGGGRAISLWNAATGEEIHEFPNRGQPNAVAFSPDGKILATTYTSCHLWDAATGKELRELKGHSNGLRSIAFAPDGKTLATSSYDGTARIWETSTGKELRRLDCKQGFLYSAAYSPDGKILATGGKNRTIRLWDPATGIERRLLQGHKDAIWDLVFSADGKHLASSSDDGTIRLWEPATGKQIRLLDNKIADSRSSIAFSPDGALLAFSRHDGVVCLWDMASGQEKRRWQAGVLSWGGVLVFSPDSHTLATGWNGCIRFWDVATAREKNPSLEHRGTIKLLRFSPKGKTLISIGKDQRLLEWDLVTNTPRQSFSWSPKRTIVFALSGGGDTLAVDGWPEAHLRLWDVRTGKPGRALGKPPKEPFWGTIALSDDGRLAAAQGDDRVIHLWDAVQGKEVRQFKGIGHRLMGLTFSPDGKCLAGGNVEPGGGEKGVHLWNANSGKEVRSFKSAGTVSSLAFSPDGSMLAAGKEGIGREAFAGAVQLWNLVSAQELSYHTGHDEGVGAVAFSPDGKLVASGTGSTGWSDNSVHVWEAATGQLIRRFEGHHSCVGSLAFSPDGLTVASGAGDSTILLWDITGRRSDGRWHKKPLSPRELESCWNDLANTDAAKAYAAIWALVAAPEQAVPFLRKKLPPIPRPDAKAIARWIADLDSDDFSVREKATEELRKLGDAAALSMRRALEGKPSAEARHRLEQLLAQIRAWPKERLRDQRAFQALEHIGTPSARDALQRLADGAPGVFRTEEAKACLRRLQQR